MIHKMKESAPIKIAVVGSIIITFIVALVGLGFGGVYYLTLQEIHKQEVQQSELHYREMTAAVRTSIPTCKALMQMDNASHGATFPNYPHVSQSQGYGFRLAIAIHNVYKATRCGIILSGKPLSVIVRELNNGS